MNMTKMPAIVSWQTMRQRMEHISSFAPYCGIVDDLGSEWPSLEDLNRCAKVRSPDLGLEFIAQVPGNRRKRGDAPASSSLIGYIQMIATQGLVPMRPQSIHDLFNYMTFLLFPRSKLALMKIHQKETELLAQSPIPLAGGRGRSRIQDLATLFDEGGSIAFGDRPEDLIVFGHGILEQFINEPRRVRAFCWRPRQFPGISNISDLPAILDQELAMDLAAVEPLHDQSRFSGQWIPESLTFPAPFLTPGL